MNVITPEQLLTLKELALSLRQQIERGDPISPSQQRSFTTICFALPDLVDNVEHLRDSRNNLQNEVWRFLIAVASDNRPDYADIERFVSVDVEAIKALSATLEPQPECCKG